MEENINKMLSVDVNDDILDIIQSLRYETKEYGRLLAYYRCAIMEVETKFNVLNVELSMGRESNPIESIKSRLKSPESIVEKMQRKNIEWNVDAIEKNIFDIAGVRVICSFQKDIYVLADSLIKQDDIRLIEVKDYIKNPKENGYRSLHLIVETPIFLLNEKRLMKVEIQLRTIAMDFWASLEHKIYYKFEGNAPASIQAELKTCADMVDLLDAKMFALNQQIVAAGEEAPG